MDIWAAAIAATLCAAAAGCGGSSGESTSGDAHCARPNPIGGVELRNALVAHGLTASCQTFDGPMVVNFKPTTQGAESSRANRAMGSAQSRAGVVVIDAPRS